MSTFDDLKKAKEELGSPFGVGKDLAKTLSASGTERRGEAIDGARGVIGQVAESGVGKLANEATGEIAGPAVGAAIGLGNVLSKPAGSLERALTAQSELKKAADIVPVVGPVAADLLNNKINQTFGPKSASVTEGAEFDVKGSLGGSLNGDGTIQVGNERVANTGPSTDNVSDLQVTGSFTGDGAGVLPDGSIAAGNGQVIDANGNIHGGVGTVTEGEGFTVEGAVAGASASSSQDNIDTGNGQIVTPDGEIIDKQ